ncbi:MAG: DNA cytosine methyltransferase [Candidatus Nanoarchaeia archaeon]|nr:DNA cytosine methyltransferase [Candidatus Nanoarchaeia archaeon]
MIESLKFIDLFAGIGGFRIALENNQAKCVFSSEIDKFAKITYKENFNEIPYGDITQIDESKIPKHDILCAGFPCQPFSISGKQKGFYDTKGTLFFEIVRIVNYHKPKIIFLENVKNLINHSNGKTFKTILKTLKLLNYNVFYDILSSSHYGVPQSRQRIYIVCFRKDLEINNFNFPNPTNKEIYLKDILEKNNETKNYIIKRNDVKFWEKDETPILKPIQIGEINKGGQGERIYSTNGHAITLSAYGGGVGGKTGVYLINEEIRKLTPRECARVQGFPEWFKIPVSKAQAYKQFGNSVSIPVIEYIFKEILNALDKKTKEQSLSKQIQSIKI